MPRACQGEEWKATCNARTCCSQVELTACAEKCRARIMFRPDVVQVTTQAEDVQRVCKSPAREERGTKRKGHDLCVRVMGQWVARTWEDGWGFPQARGRASDSLARSLIYTTVYLAHSCEKGRPTKYTSSQVCCL